MSGAGDHERQLVRSFILPARQERHLELLAKPKRRKVITDSLAHFKHLDMRYAVKIPPSHRLAPSILELLKSKGAPDTCYILSEDPELDGKELPLRDALNHIFGSGMGTFLSCIPGKLAYFEDEEENWILERNPRTKVT